MKRPEHDQENPVTGTAKLSADERYRYLLTRTWDPAGPACGWVMLNPSTADAWTDDATIRRVVGFSRAWGAGTAVVANLYALRATDPDELREATDPIGPENTAALAGVAALPVVVCAWGAETPRLRAGGAAAHGAHVAAVMGLLHDAGASVRCLGTTASGAPRHPLYLPTDTLPRAFPGPAS